MKERKRAILYIRVSTDEQKEKGYSLGYQLEKLQRYCEVQNLDPVAVFQEDYSAKTFDRPEFQKMLRQLKTKQLYADWLLFIKWDRFSRNTADSYMMIDRLDKLGVQVQAIEQPIDLRVPENKVILAVYLSVPEVENVRRGLNVTSGMRKAKKSGRWMATAPKGYSNLTDISGKKYIAPNQDAPMVRWIFEELTENTSSAIDVLRKANRKGFNCSRNNFWKMVRNPVYCGKIYIPATEDEEAYYAQGLHDPLISEELFYSVQDVLDGRSRPKPSKVTKKEELPLRGFLVCRKCGNNLTGSASTGKMGVKYFYYHCQKGCDERFKAREANDLFVKGLETLIVKSKAIDLYYLAVKKAFSINESNKIEQIASIKRQIDVLQQRIEKARNLMLDDKIDAIDFKEAKANLQPQIEKLSRKITEYTAIEEGYKTFVEDGFGVLKNLPDTYARGDLSTKQQIISSIFPEKLIFENNQYRTPKLLRPFERILSIGSHFSTKTKRTEAIFIPQSSQVIPLGFEPRTPTLKV
jgi:site-specific DNA recombinase